MKQCLYDTYVYAQHHGWYEIWRQIVDMTDPRGEQNAYKVTFILIYCDSAEMWIGPI